LLLLFRFPSDHTVVWGSSLCPFLSCHILPAVCISVRKLRDNGNATLNVIDYLCHYLYYSCLNPPLLQDAVGSHIYGNIGGSFLEAKAFYPHRHSRWLKHAKAPKKWAWLS
jgi:hypothetical protein